MYFPLTIWASLEPTCGNSLLRPDNLVGDTKWKFYRYLPGASQSPCATTHHILYHIYSSIVFSCLLNIGISTSWPTTWYHPSSTCMQWRNVTCPVSLLSYSRSTLLFLIIYRKLAMAPRCICTYCLNTYFKKLKIFEQKSCVYTRTFYVRAQSFRWKMRFFVACVKKTISDTSL